MNSNQPEIEAAEWLARLDRKEPTASELAAFDRWMAADARHAAAYARLAATWQALDRIRAARPGAEEPIDIDYLMGVSDRPASSTLQTAPPMAAAQASLSSGNESSRELAESPLPSRIAHPRARRRAWPYPSLAASLLIAVAVFWNVNQSAGPQIYRTGVGGFQRIVLADQSSVDLNTDTEVRVALTAKLRTVDLVRGEANFEVAHDASRPFIVSAGNMAVRAVGTNFDVRRQNDSIEVTVKEGKVAIGDASLLEASAVPLPITLPQVSAGQSATSSGSGVTLKTIPKSAITRKLAWQNQMLVFDADSLSEVVAQFNRYNERKIVIADPHLADLRIGGYFRPTNLDAFLSVLESDFGVRVNDNGRQLVLSAAAAK
jgi:transmembrane sensor